MKLGFTHSYSLVTPLSPQEVLARLQDNTEPIKFRFKIWTRPKNLKNFDGQIEGQTFNIRRLIWYHNSFLPSISGSVTAIENATRIDIRMRLHEFFLLFLAGWIVCVTIGLFFLFLTANSQRPGQTTGILAMCFLFWFILCGFAYLIAAIPFWGEAKYAQKLLETIWLPNKT